MRIAYACILICMCYVKGINGIPFVQHWNGEDEPGLEHIIDHIPGLDRMPDAEMFAGHLVPMDPSTHSNASSKRMYYWLNRSQDPESKTLVIWLNGGPGRSSLLGLFSEHGPLTFDPETRNLTEQEYSWNRFAHTLYIEVPAGVGFSFDDSPSTHVFTDNTTVTDIVGVVYNFLQLHPRYLDFDIYLAGESYAGIWHPQVAQRLIKNKSTLNLNIKGIILGNPKLKNGVVAYDDNALSEFLYYHGLIGKDTLEFVVSHDCMNVTTYERYDSATTKRCDEEMLAINTFVYENATSIDSYEITRECWKVNQPRMDVFYTEVMSLLPTYHNESATPEEQKDFNEKFEVYKSLLRSVDQKPHCDEIYSQLENFLSDSNVQDAIHAKFGREGPLNFNVHSLSVVENYMPEIDDMSLNIKELVTTLNATTLLYFGDQDIIASLSSGLEFVSGLGLEKTSSHQPYFIYEADGLIRKVAGYTEEYIDRLKYATVKGAGHMAPKQKPEATYTLVSEWITSNRHN